MKSRKGNIIEWYSFIFTSLIYTEKCTFGSINMLRPGECEVNVSDVSKPSQDLKHQIKHCVAENWQRCQWTKRPRQRYFYGILDPLSQIWFTTFGYRLVLLWVGLTKDPWNKLWYVIFLSLKKINLEWFTNSSFKNINLRSSDTPWDPHLWDKMWS